MSSESPRSALSWVFIIALGVMLGNGFSVLTERLYTQYHLGHFPGSLQELGRLFGQQVARTPAEQQRQLAENKTQTQLNANCDYWEEQVDQKDNSQNRAFRDMACARAKGMYR